MTPKKTTKADKIAQARKARQRTFALPACKVDLELRKWNLDQILNNATFLVDIVQDLASSKDPAVLARFLNSGLTEVLGQYKKRVTTIVANTLHYDYENEGLPYKFKDNFESDEESVAFVRELDGEDLFALIREIFVDNFGPLAARLGLSGKSPAEILKTLQAMRTPTLSTN